MVRANSLLANIASWHDYRLLVQKRLRPLTSAIGRRWYDLPYCQTYRNQLCLLSGLARGFSSVSLIADEEYPRPKSIKNHK